MKRPISIGIICVLVLVGFFTVAQSRSSASQKQQIENNKDTIPQKREGKIKDLDAAMAELEKAMQQLDKEFKKPLPAIPPIEVQKMKAELEQALKEVDPEKIKAEIAAAMKQIDAEKIKMDVQAALAKVDMEKVRMEIAKIKEVELPKLEKEMEKIGPQIEKSLAAAKVSIEKAKKEVQEYKDLEDSLEKDGLISKDNYTLEHKNGVFSINGKTQPEAVYNKYRAFLENHKEFTLKKDGDGLEINNDKD